MLKPEPKLTSFKNFGIKNILMNLISSHKRPIQTAVTKRLHTKFFASVLSFAHFKTKVVTFSAGFWEDFWSPIGFCGCFAPPYAQCPISTPQEMTWSNTKTIFRNMYFVWKTISLRPWFETLLLRPTEAGRRRLEQIIKNWYFETNQGAV